MFVICDSTLVLVGTFVTNRGTFSLIIADTEGTDAAIPDGGFRIAGIVGGDISDGPRLGMSLPRRMAGMVGGDGEKSVASKIAGMFGGEGGISPPSRIAGIGGGDDGMSSRRLDGSCISFRERIDGTTGGDRENSGERRFRFDGFSMNDFRRFMTNDFSSWIPGIVGGESGAKSALLDGELGRESSDISPSNWVAIVNGLALSLVSVIGSLTSSEFIAKSGSGRDGMSDISFCNDPGIAA